MRFYLSSYKLGNETQRLQELVPKGKIGYIPSALDFTGADVERRAIHIGKDVDALRTLGFVVEVVELREYFGRQDELRAKLDELGAVFVSGGNVFVLRQAMKLSGFDTILKQLQETNFLYAGYSAAGCVLGPDLHAYEVVDKVDTPYPLQREVIWEGLGLVDFAFMPHWDSDHPESVDIDKEIELCKASGRPYTALRDGEVLIIE